MLLASTHLVEAPQSPRSTSGRDSILLADLNDFYVTHSSSTNKGLLRR